MAYKRPPLGLISRKLFLEMRISDLTNAIARYVKTEYGETVIVSGKWYEWVEELSDRHKELKTLIGE